MVKGKKSEKTDGSRPKFTTYIRAVVKTLKDWMGQHKKLTTLYLALFIILCTLLLVWLWPNSAQKSNDDIILQVNKMLSIQGDSNPVILTVEDETKATQPFLDQAENGDKVLLYYKAKKAVLYRPSTEAVIHQGSYTPPDAKVFIRQGTTDAGRVEAVEKQLESVSEIDVVSQDSSTRTDYTGITLVSVTDRYDDKLEELEDLFGVEAVRLPAGESFPDADILVIVGS